MLNIHNEWDERYSQHDHIYGEQANAFIQDITQKLSIHGKTLGLAEGEGRNLLYIWPLWHKPMGKHLKQICGTTRKLL